MNSTAARNTQLFSGDLRPNPGIPAHWPEAKQRRAREIHDDVRAAFPEMLGEPTVGADIEDHFEDAARLSAAWRASGGDLALKGPGTMEKAWSEDELRRRLGPVYTVEEGGKHGRDRLAAHPIVMKYAGRGIHIGAIDVESPETDVCHWLASRHRDQGVSRGIVKATAHKNGIWSIELDSDPAVIRRRLSEAMDWTFVRLEGRPGAVMAQDCIEDLVYEMRCFVVDGEVISSAGCIEEFTPLDHEPENGPFDTRLRRTRGHLHQGDPSTVEDLPELASRLLDFGRKVAREHGGTVVIDVALDANRDAPVVVELNNLPNSGLYASDPWLVTSAVVWAMDRGYDAIRTVDFDNLIRL